MKKLIPFTLAFGLVCLQWTGSAHAQLSDTLQKIKSSGVIHLGGRDATLPFSYVVNGSPIGFSADLCQKVVDAVKSELKLPDLKVQYTIVTPANRIPLVQNGTIDLECSTTTNTAARAQQVDFAPTHFVSSIAIAVKKTSGIKSLTDLGGKTVSTVTGSTSIQVLRTHRRNDKLDIKEVSGKDDAETFLLFATGRADAMILDDVKLASLIAQESQPGDYRILDDRLRDEPYGFMYRKNDPQFKAVVDRTLAGLMRNGEMDSLYTKWFLRPVPPRGLNLNFPMTPAVKEAYRNPSSRGI